jgi:transcriptional regulator with XRE-family HTH domain
MALAKKAGLGTTYVRDVLNGKNKNPRSDHLARIATALDCSVLDLIDPALAKAPIRDSEVVEKAEERALLAYWRALPAESRELLVLQMFKLRSGAPSNA